VSLLFLPAPLLHALLAIGFRYFSDRLSDTDVFLAPVLFRVVTGYASQRLQTAALPMEPLVNSDDFSVKPWRSTESQNCLSFEDGESVCVLDNRSESVCHSNQPRCCVFNVTLSSGLVARAHDQRPFKIRMVPP
jgi:hypothetical protein